MKPGGWIGVDLDGTLAQDLDQPFDAPIGPPVPEMLERVKQWRAEGVEVRIFTARLALNPDAEQVGKIIAWLLEHVGEALPVTCRKDHLMIELWDDRAVQVIRNTGERVGNHFRRQREGR